MHYVDVARKFTVYKSFVFGGSCLPAVEGNFEDGEQRMTRSGYARLTTPPFIQAFAYSHDQILQSKKQPPALGSP